jgi:hypothetical protein
MKKTYTEFGDYADRTGSEEPLGLLSGAFILLAMIAVSVMIADVATGFNLHEVIGNLISINV